MKLLSSSKISSIFSLLDAEYSVRETALSAGVSIVIVDNINKTHMTDSPKVTGGRKKKLSTIMLPVLSVLGRQTWQYRFTDIQEHYQWITKCLDYQKGTEEDWYEVSSEEEEAVSVQEALQGEGGLCYCS